MRQPKAIPLDQVPEVTKAAVATPSGRVGDVVYADGIHRWRKNKDGKLLYYIRYANERLDRQDARYDSRGAR